jgi:hypothetical protein
VKTPCRDEWKTNNREQQQMARPTLNRNPKYLALIRRLGLPRYAVRGLLDEIWDCCHESGNPVLRAHHVEAVAGWDGQAGALLEALIDEGFLDKHDDTTVEVHDYWHHAPDYVLKRRDREQERILNSIPRKRKGKRQTTADNGGQRQTSAANGAPPSPSLTPTLTPSPTPVNENANARGEPVDVGYFSGRLPGATPPQEEPEQFDIPVQVQAEAERIVERFVKRRYGSQANIPGTYRRSRDVYECAQVMEFHPDAVLKLDRYFDKPTLQGNAAFYQILQELGLDARVEKTRASPVMIDMKAAVRQKLAEIKEGAA